MMLQSVMNLRNWLKQVQTHADDGRWFSKHEDVLYPLIAGSLQKPPEFRDAAELLMAVFHHYAFVLYHVKRWSPLLLDALVHAQTLRDNEMQIRILTYLGENYLTSGKYAAAGNTFKIALERARDGQTKEMMLAAYIGLIRMQSVHLADSFDPDLFVKSLTLSKQVN